MKLFKLFLCVCFLLPLSANAERGTGVSNGGDPIELEFQGFGRSVVELIKEFGPEKFPEIDLKKFSKAVESTKLEAVKTALYASDQPNERTAINIPSEKLIRINISRWSLLGMDLNQKLSFVLHEYLGILGIEVNHYAVSTRLFALLTKELLNPSLAGIPDKLPKTVFGDPSLDGLDLSLPVVLTLKEWRLLAAQSKPEVTVEPSLSGVMVTPGDEAALRLAFQTVSAQLLKVAQNNTKIRALQLKAVTTEQTLSAGAYESIHEEFQKYIQLYYKNLIEEMGSPHKGMFNAIKLCKTSFCVKQISFAEKELIEFGHKINLSWKTSQSFESEMIHFESPLIQITAESLFAVLLEKYLKENDLSVYQVASGLSPILYAARSKDGAQFGAEWKKSLLFSGQKRMIQFEKSAPVPKQESLKMLKQTVEIAEQAIQNGKSYAEYQQEVEPDRIPGETYSSVLSCVGVSVDVQTMISFDNRQFHSDWRCENFSDSEDVYRYEVELGAVGYGVGVYQARSLIFVSGPIRRFPIGTWLGVRATAVPGIGGGMTITFGSGFSVAVVLTAGFGLHLDVSAIQLKINRYKPNGY